MSKLSALVCACIVLGGCASSPHDGRVQLTAPNVMSNVYSEVNMRVMLVTTPDANTQCTPAECEARAAFDQRVAAIGPSLAKSAFRHYPELASRVRNFEFIIVDKTEPGTASTAAGRIIILRPVALLAPTDEALAFIIAREIGHVVAQHHEENTATSFIVSALAQIFAPIANIGQLFSSILSGTAVGAGAYVAGASVTAASLVGSKVVASSYKPRQCEEADAIAMNLLGDMGYDAPAVARAFARSEGQLQRTGWTRELLASVERLSARPATAGAMSALPPGKWGQSNISSKRYQVGLMRLGNVTLTPFSPIFPLSAADKRHLGRHHRQKLHVRLQRQAGHIEH